MTSEEREWCVVTWNIQGAKRTDLRRIAEVLDEARPDAVLIQETRRAQARELADRLGMRVEWAYKHWALTPFFTQFAEGAAILTPHFLSSTGDSVISSTTSRRTWRRRIVMWGLVERDDQTAYRVYNAHLTPHDAAAERLAEAGRISEIVEAAGDAPPAVVGGDFNDVDQPELLDALPGVEHVRPAPTNPASAPMHVIDHVLLPVEATGVTVDVPPGGPEWRNVSDHLPVIVRFRLRWVRGEFA